MTSSFQYEIWLGVRSDVSDGGGLGTRGSPYAVNTPGTFASIFDAIPSSAVIRLMPGIYRTRGTIGNGYDMSSGFFSPRDGQRLIGSGMLATTIQFVWDISPPAFGAYHPGQRHYVISSPNYLSSFTLEDLSLDCNLQNTPFTRTADPGPNILATTSGTGFTTVTATDPNGVSVPFFTPDMVGSTIVFAGISARITNVPTTPSATAMLTDGVATTKAAFNVFGVRFTVTALSVAGDNVRIRRVRVINFGTRTPGSFDGASDLPSPAPGGTYEGFPLRVEGRTAGLLNRVDSTTSGYTASTSGNVVTASGGTGGMFTPAMVGSVIRFSTSPTTTLDARITGFTDSTHITINTTPSPSISGVNFSVLTDLDKPAFNSVIEDCVFEQPHPSPGREVTCAILSSGVGRVTDPTNKLHLQPFGSVIRNCYFNFDLVNQQPGNQLPISLIGYSGMSAPYTVTVKTLYPHNVLVGNYVQIVGNNVGTLNDRWTVASIVDDYTLTFQVSPTLPPNPTTLGSLFKSTQPSLPVVLAPSDLNANWAKALTQAAHGRKANDWVWITGASDETYNGYFQIRSVDSANGTRFDYDLGVAAPAAPTGSIWADRRPNGFVSVSSVTLVNTTPPTGRLTCRANHYRRVDDWIAFGGVLTAGVSPANGTNSYNNYARVSAVINKTTLEVELPGLNNVGSLNSSFSQGLDAGFGTSFQALSNNGGLGGGTFSNRISAANRGLYHDTWMEEQFIARRNYFYDTYLALFMPLIAGTYRQQEGTSGDVFFLGSTTVAAGIVTFTLASAVADPGWHAGMAMFVSNASGVPSSVQILTVTPPSGGVGWKFTFALPVGNTFGGSAIADIWTQQSSVVFENNIVEMRLTPKGGTNNGPTAIAFGGPFYSDNPLPVVDPNGFVRGNAVHGLLWNGPLLDPSHPVGPGNPHTAQQVWMVQRALVRGNFVRKIGNRSDPDSLSESFGIHASAQNLIIEDNILGALNNPALAWDRQPLELDYFDSQRSKSFNNQWPEGKLRQLFSDPHWFGNPVHWVNEIQTLADDALWAGKLKKI